MLEQIQQGVSGVLLRRRIEQLHPDATLSPEMTATVQSINTSFFALFGQYILKQKGNAGELPFQLHVVDNLSEFAKNILEYPIDERVFALTLPYANTMLIQDPLTTQLPDAVTNPFFLSDVFPLSYAHELAHMLQNRRLMLNPHPGAAVFYECGARFYAAQSTEELTFGSPLILNEEGKYRFYETLIARFGEDTIHSIFFGSYLASRKQKRTKEQEVFDFAAKYSEILFPQGRGLHL